MTTPKAPGAFAAQAGGAKVARKPAASALANEVRCRSRDMDTLSAEVKNASPRRFSP